MKIEKEILNALESAFEHLLGQVPEKPAMSLQKTKKEFEGDYTFVTFPYGKMAKKRPDELAEELGSWLAEHAPLVHSYNVVKGFLNIKVDDGRWLQYFQEEVLSPHFAIYAQREERVVVEYSSPNTNKPLHLGHLRNNFLGYAVSNILEAYGYQVIKANLINDRGIHICKSMLAYRKFGHGETPEERQLKGDQLVGEYYVLFDRENKKQAKEQGIDEQQTSLMEEARQLLQHWEEGDPETVELWKMMNEWVYAGFEQTYQRMGVSFDHYYYESDTYLLGKDIIDEGLEKQVFYRKADGSVWIDLTEEGLDEKLVLRQDGTSLYITQDMGTADLKAKDHQPSQSIYVVGNEQDYHFKVLFLIMKKFGRDYAAGMRHLSYGMVDLPSGKMKSREGTVVDADDLMEEMVGTAKERSAELGKIEEMSEEEKATLYEMVGIGAIKYYLLRVEPKKRMLFDPEESIDLQGDTATFMQYTHARCMSVMRRAQRTGDIEHHFPRTLQPMERELIQLLSELPATIAEAAQSYAPSVLINYSYELAKTFNRFYSELSILGADAETEKNLRVSITGLVAHTIKRCMELVGIEVPDRM